MICMNESAIKTIKHSKVKAVFIISVDILCKYYVFIEKPNSGRTECKSYES